MLPLLSIVSVPAWGVLLAATLLLFLLYGSLNFTVFWRQGVPGPIPLPYVGTALHGTFGGVANYDLKLRKFGKVVGTFAGRIPNLVIFDGDLLSEVLVKRFDCFINRREFSFGDKAADTMLAVVRGQRWKHIRTQMTPAFSPSRIREMAPLIAECAAQFVSNLSTYADTGHDVDMKGLAGSLTMDVIARTVFGLRVDSQNEPDNLFVRNVRKVRLADSNPGMLLSIILPTGMASCLRRLGLAPIPQDVLNVFYSMTRQAMDAQVGTSGQKRANFVQLIKDGDNVGLTLDEILGNSFLVYLAAFDTTSSGLTMFFHNMAVNQQCQDRLLQEIDNLCSQQGPVTYDTLTELTYLDQCLKESLRLFPSIYRVERFAGCDVTIGNIKIPKGAAVTIPIFGIQRDPNIWPDPDTFDPDRFAPSAMGSHGPYDWLPFGGGPRSCIGTRLALILMKMAIVHVLREFRIVMSPNTQNPFQLDTRQVVHIMGSTRKCYMKVEARRY